MAEVSAAAIGALSVLGSALLSALAAFYAARASRQAARDSASLERVKLDADAYQRARAMDKEILEDLRQQLAATRAQLTTTEAVVAALRKEVDVQEIAEDSLRRENWTLQMRVARLEQLTAGLQALLRDANVKVPTHLQILSTTIDLPASDRDDDKT